MRDYNPDRHTKRYFNSPHEQYMYICASLEGFLVKDFGLDIPDLYLL